MKPLAGGTRRSKQRSKKAAREVREARFELRCDATEKATWSGAATLAGYLSLSDWIRDLANAAAKRAPLLSSADQTHNTPPEILDPIRAHLGAIGLDPCSNEGSIVDARTAWTLERDGDSLERAWSGHGIVFVNPPYGRSLAEWAEKLATEARAGVEIIAIVPARVGTAWWSVVREEFDAIILRGRVAFLDPATGEPSANAPFEAAILYSGPRSSAARDAFRDREAEYLPRRQLALYAGLSGQAGAA